MTVASDEVADSAMAALGVLAATMMVTALLAIRFLRQVDRNETGGFRVALAVTTVVAVVWVVAIVVAAVYHL